MSESSVTPPETIGPYRVIRPLARGGMAAVYEVEDAESGQRLALKLLTQKGLAKPRFSREYRALIRLDHPNIVRVYRYGLAEDQTPYLTMELLDGVAAQVHAKACGRPGTPRRTAEVLRIVTAVADALGYLHERGIVHRDLKSSNVMVLRDGRIKLLDFGIARLLGSAEDLTRHGEFVGTFAYASPEQLNGETVDARSDIYSLAVLFYRLLTGKRPFEGANPQEIARLHMNHLPRPPVEVVAGIPPKVSALVMSMLSKAPADRPQSAHAVAHVLRGIVRTMGAAPTSTFLADPQVVGRDDEVRALRSAFNKARPGRVIVVSGTMGSGRGRLMAQAARDAASLGWRVYEGVFPGPPGLGAIADVLRTASRGLELPAGAVSDPDLAVISALPGRRRADSQTLARLFEAVSNLLRRRIQVDEQPVALMLRELDRAPELAIQALRVVRQLAVTENLPIQLVLATTEEGDAPGSALRQNFPEAQRLLLGPLDPADVGKLVGTVLGRQAPPPVLSRRICEATGGLPGYVVEVVYQMVRQGLVETRRTDDDRVEWVDRSGGRIAIPGSVRDIIMMRIDALPRQALRVLEALAVAGGEASPEVLRHATELDPQEAAESLAHLARERMIVERGDGSWSIRLGLTAQLVRERIRLSRRHLLQRRLAEALWDAPPNAEKVRLLLSAGFVDQALTDGVDWAGPLLEDRRGAEVLPVIERLVDRSAEATGADPSRLARLHLLHAAALGMVAPAEPRARESLDRAHEMADSPELRAEVDLERADFLLRHGDTGAALASLDELAARGLAERRVATRVLLGQGRARLLGGLFRPALESYVRARNEAESIASVRLAAEARVGLGIARHAMGDLLEAEADLVEGMRAHAGIGNDQGQWHAAMNLAEVYRVQGRLTESVRAVEPLLEAARLGGRPQRLAGILLNLAETCIELCRLGEVRDLLGELDTLDVAHTDPYVAGAAALMRGRLRLASNDPNGAVRALAPAARSAEKAGLPVLAAQLGGYLGEALALSGERSEGESESRRAISVLVERAHVPATAEACACRARALGTRADPDEVFEPVLTWIHGQPARLARTAYLLASADFAAALGDARRAYVYYRDAADALGEIKDLLSPADAAALRIHPWEVRIQRRLQVF